MFWKKVCIRYYPPGIALYYRTPTGIDDIKHIDLFDLDIKTNIDQLTRKLISTDTLITSDIYSPLKNALNKLQKKLKESTRSKFYLYRTLKSHLLPLTNVSFDKAGGKCLTGSYDRTCRIINTRTGVEENCLRGHENVVFSVGFNFPLCDRIITGSFDKTVKIWSTSDATYMKTYFGHTAEVVGAEFQPNDFEIFATASMDNTSRTYHVESGQELGLFDGHRAEVIVAKYNREGNLLLTGSFDKTAIIWDTRTKRIINQLNGHTAELSNCVWNYSGNLIATGSLDGTARVWDLRMMINQNDNSIQTGNNESFGKSLYTIRGHTDEVLDIAFDYTGRKLATASSDCTVKVWDVNGPADYNLLTIMTGHTEEVSKVCFSPAGNLLMTASADKTARLWHNEDGICSQILSGHDEEVFSCAFSYMGDVIVTASKDNTCKIWR